MNPFGRSFAASKPGGAEFMAMIGSGVGIVLAFMLGMDAGLCPADSSAAQAHGQYLRLAAPKSRPRAAQTKRQSGFQCTESREHLP
jgi:hypothetical protein